MAESLAEAIQSSTWERALFTTYSLSLTFFESVILRLLRQSSCREIWVIADAQGYQASLMERRSHGVGQEYHLVPCALPHGVFHPKCCYLEGPHGDLLAIGSGNLTFGGFGRNLEVLDVLSAEEEPDCFHEFGSFLNALRRRSDFSCPEPSWMDTFADRAFSVAGKSIAKRDRLVWLLHSAEAPVWDQVADHLNGRGAVQRITVLSPYHDVDGTSVRVLAKQTTPEGLEIGLPPSPHSSCFPFPAAEGWGIRIAAVRAGLAGEKRPLHAKWIEWKTPEGIFALTGSVNSTRQALLTTNNIEVGVLRFDPSGEGWTNWKKAAVPAEHTVVDYRPAGLLSLSLVYAELRSSGELRGRIICSQSAAGRWAGLLLKSTGESTAFQADVTDGGYFQALIPQFEELAFASALQIMMTLGANVARGWVQNTEILAMPRLRKLGISSLLRLINREGTTDDDVALLDYLAIHASEHLPTFRHAIRQPKPSPQGDPRDEHEVIHLEALAPSDIPEHDPHDATTPDMTPSSALDRIFSQLRRRLLGATTRETNVPGFSGIESEGEDGTDEPDQREENESIQPALDYFGERMHELVESEAMDPAKRGPLLVLWLEVTMHMLVGRQSDRRGALSFLENWFRLATAKGRVEEKTVALEQHVVTAAAILRLTSNEGSTNQPQQLHEGLESFWSGSVAADRAKQSLLTDSRIALGGLLLDYQPKQLEAALEEVLASRTIREDIAEILNAHRENAPLPHSPIFESEAGQALRRELLRKIGKRRVRRLTRPELACPNCFCTCCSSVASALQTNRIAVCTSCGWVILRTMP